MDRLTAHSFSGNFYPMSAEMDHILSDKIIDSVSDEELKEIFKPGTVVKLTEIPTMIAKHLDPASNPQVVSISSPHLGRFIEERMSKVFPGFGDEIVENIKTGEGGFLVPDIQG